jgi:hypothetical protein
VTREGLLPKKIRRSNAEVAQPHMRLMTVQKGGLTERLDHWPNGGHALTQDCLAPLFRERR